MNAQAANPKLMPATNRNGYSLIELITVLAIIGAISASITIRWSDVYRKTQFEADAEKIAAFDYRARRQAINQNRPCRLVFDFENQILRSSRWMEGKERFAKTQPSSPTKVAQVITTNGVYSRETFELNIEPSGSTKTYAILIQSGQDQKWILFAGRTGQTNEYSNKKDVEALFAALKSSGPNAN